ncbi:MAG: hypothetical protein ABI574_06210 [Burkholderiales bacterium]
MPCGLAIWPAAGWAQERPVYRCPGNLYTDQITVKEAAERGCKTLEGAPVTIIQATPPRARDGGAKPAAAAGSAVNARVEAAEQRARDSDARRILDSELRRDEDRLTQLQKEYNNGEPERRGEERNYAKYQERVADLKAAIARKEADIAALKRELAKLPPG